MMRILIGLCLLGSLQMYSMDSQDQIKRSPSREKASPRRQTSPRERQKIEVSAAHQTIPAARKKRLMSEENVKMATKRELQTRQNPDKDLPLTKDGKPSPKMIRTSKNSDKDLSSTKDGKPSPKMIRMLHS